MARTRFSRPALTTLLASLLVLGAGRVRADELPADPQATTSLLVGAGIAAASFGVGMTLTGTSHEGAVQNAGILTAQSGLVLAPLAAHGVAGEWRRGLLFSLPPLATELGMLLLIDHWGDRLVTLAPLGTQYVYVALFTGTMLASAVGIIDATGARDRASAKAKVGGRTWVLPMVDRSGGGVSVGGWL